MSELRPLASPEPRRRLLIDPAVQLRLIAVFVGTTTVGLLLQAQLLVQELAELSAGQGPDGLSSDLITALALRSLALSALWVLPLTVAVGILSTFRIAGPLYRIRQHLAAIERGEDPGECRVRRKDQLQDLCAQLNRALDVARGRRQPVGTGAPERDSEAA